MSGPFNRYGNVRTGDLPYIDVRRFGCRLNGSDDTSALSRAFASGERLWVPHGVCAVDRVTGDSIDISGNGTIRKLPGTKGAMLTFTGESVVRDLTLDYDWSSADGIGSTATYGQNNIVRQVKGSLRLLNVDFRRPLVSAVTAVGASLFVDGRCRFTGSAQHNGASDTTARAPHYVVAQADEETEAQVISVAPGAYFQGSSADPLQAHLNPTGVIVNSHSIDGPRFKTVAINGAIFRFCGTNAGVNITGAIDIYNGAENIIIAGNSIRSFSYAGVKVQNSSRVNVIGNLITDGYAPEGSGVPGHSFGIQVSEKSRTSVADQTAANISHNVLQRMSYAGIYNSIDDVNIIGNQLDGVAMSSVQGNGIENIGSNVCISQNIGSEIEGYLLKTTGSNVDVSGNNLRQKLGSMKPGIYFSGAGVSFRENKIVGAPGANWTASREVGVGEKVYWSSRAYLVTAAGALDPLVGPTHTSGTQTNGTASLQYIAPSGIRTDGPASRAAFDGNYLHDFSLGLDLRIGSGAVSGVDLRGNQYGTIVSAAENIAAGVTGVTKNDIGFSRVGDANTTAPRSANSVVHYSQPVTADRTVTPFSGASVGSSIRVVREATATGAAVVRSPSSTDLAAGQWVLDVWTGAAWERSAKGAL